MKSSFGSRVLVVEDDPALLRGITDNFRHEGFQVDTAEDGERAIEMAMNGSPDIVILDVMLPKVNGYEVCRYLRQENLTTPILFLTAKGEESDVLLGLGLGGDDYVVKPFRIRELVARVEAILRRSTTGSNGDAEDESFGKFVLERRARRLRTKDGETVGLSPKEYDLLDYFLRNRGRALSREKIMLAVWGAAAAVTFRSVDRFVTHLRKILESEPGEHIETIRGFGYRFRNGAPKDAE